MELWDLYTKDRERTGKTMVRGAKHPAGFYRLVVHVCVFNSRGEMLIQRRQLTKFGWPGLWDVTASGSVIAGETSSAAAEREVREELGVTIPFANLRPALTIHFPEGFGDVYLIERDLDIDALTLQAEEVMGAKWASESEIMEMLSRGEFIPYVKDFVGLLFYLRNHATLHTAPDLTRE